jgi:copper transport protein
VVIRRALIVLAGLGLALALVPVSPASAHALLEGTAPERGAVVETAPGQVVLRFSEPVEIEFGAVRVFDAAGRQVEVGKPFHPAGRGAAVAVRLRPGLARGGYTATYRVVSADAHPVSGGFVFSVGSRAAPAASVADLLGKDGAGPVTAVAFAGVRAVQFAAITLAIGVLASLLFAWMPALRETTGASEAWRTAAGAFAGRSRRLLAAAAIAGIASALVALPLQAATAEGASVWSALDRAPDVLSTRFGVVWGVGALLWLAVLTMAAGVRDAVPTLRPATVGATGLALAGTRAGTVALAVPVVALAFLPGLGGHAGTQSPEAVLLPANVLHVLAAGVWIGGIATLVLALPAATRRLDPPDRTPLLAAVVGRFSGTALVAVAVLVAAGVLQGVLELDAVEDLWTTGFGRAVLVKSALVLVLVGLGALNRRRTVPGLRRATRAGTAPGAAGHLLRRALRAELALGVGALIATGALAGHSPSASAAAGPFSGSRDLGPSRAELTVEPARPGANEVHLYLFRRSDGRQYDAPKELRIEASLPGRGIEPIRLQGRKAGPGHYVIAGAPLSPPGTWRLEVVARVSDFDEYRTRFSVPIQ